MKLRSEMKVYKLRDTVTGLFSKGGMAPYFDKEGKTWSSRGALKSHLTQLSQGFYLHDHTPWHGRGKNLTEIPATWEIIEYVLRLEDSVTFSAQDEAKRPAKK